MGHVFVVGTLRGPSILFLVVFARIMCIIITVVAQGSLFLPATEVYVNCGGATIASVEGTGFFLPDGESLYTSKGILASNSAEGNSYGDPYEILFETARIFRSQSSYKIPVHSSGRVWLRLWFYPGTFVGSGESYNPDDARFSVIANEFTLLINLTAVDMTAGGRRFLYREFLINVTSGNLLITFKPTADAFAFISGLAVVSVPAGLLQDDVTVVPGTLVKMKMDNNAFQTMYRLNVGGVLVTPSNDSYLSREWVNDIDYLYGAVIGVTLGPIPSSQIVYPSGVPAWAAPEGVYGSARVLGSSSLVNRMANLTWIFDIDPGYAYYIRLHFDEIFYTRLNQRVFDVFINNQTAVAAYDCVAAGDGTAGSASFRDFIAPMYNDNSETLWVAMSPAEGSSEFADVILNGLEIFKINNSKGSLARSAISVQRDEEVDVMGPDVQTHDMNHLGTIIGVVVVGVAALGASLAGICFIFSHKSSDGIEDAWLPLRVHGDSSSEKAPSQEIGASNSVSSSANEDLFNRTFSFASWGSPGTNDGLLMEGKARNPFSKERLTDSKTEIELFGISEL